MPSPYSIDCIRALFAWIGLAGAVACSSTGEGKPTPPEGGGAWAGGAVDAS
jgi:hypothetical protein